MYRYSIDKSEEQIISGTGSTGSADPVLARVKRLCHVYLSFPLYTVYYNVGPVKPLITATL